ncbi:hypothetical protein GCM10025886_06540 [Tetragenococcus halophilus subsp. flandriensis]|nr:hypothetical protein [Tetragenococcus halophilus]GMA07503.1 hypothetical protein GCM10025886_06540 [Tetragenococcus halophilus subsp. flandriensis]
MGKMKALYKVFMVNSLSNKFAFIYNLLLPVLAFIYSNWQHFFHPVEMTEQQLFSGLGLFWAYIILVTLLNMVIVPTLMQRESGYYKGLYFITGSKWQVFFANFAVQVTILFFEMVLFNFVVMLILRTWSWGILLGGIASVFLLTIPVTLISSLFLTIKIKLESVTIVETATLFVLFFLAGISGHNALENFLLLLNPIKYLSQGAYHISMLFVGEMAGLPIIFSLIAITFVYLFIGSWSLAKFDIQPVLERI